METTVFMSADDANKNANGITLKASDESGIFTQANALLAERGVSNFYAWSGTPASGRMFATYGVWD